MIYFWEASALIEVKMVGYTVRQQYSREPTTCWILFLPAGDRAVDVSCSGVSFTLEPYCGAGAG
jgi:CO dehydrogenase/acetyl-CoA synthase gamma subunit (corrinoid Fe-S protein)